MYTPKHFEETDPDVLRGLMAEHPLATLVTVSSEGLVANHIPLFHAEEGGEYGVLRGHIARANPLHTDRTTDRVLAVFQGPDAYITPSWYATKQVTGKVVPTWNYVAVHAHGTIRFIEDATWLRVQLEELTARHESARPEPWSLSDAPTDYTEKLIRAIVGVEIAITRLEGKWKVSQNQPVENRKGVVAGLRGRDGTDDAPMAGLVENTLAETDRE